jgi:MFS family permease
MIIPLSRNRNYRLLWGSQALSQFGLSASTIAFPLLVLAVTGSSALAGLVLGVEATAQLIAGLPGGALVDRWDHKKVMLASEAVQAITIATLVGALWWDMVSIVHLVLVAAVIGICGALFEPAEDACLPNLVSHNQLSTAVSLNAARSHLAQLSGTAVGGFLFAVGRFVPFLVDALTHAISFFMLAFLRVPARNVQPNPERHLGREMAAGLRWVWQHRPIRVISLCAVGLNFFFSAYFIIVIVLADSRGVPSGEIGIMAAMLGVGGVLGALIAPYLHRSMSPYLSIIGVFWMLTILTPVAIFINSGYFMGALFASMAFLAPTANTTIETYQLLLTPEGLRGRLTGVMGVITAAAVAVGPALGGLLVEIVSDNQAVLLCAAGIGAVTVLTTISPTLRGFPTHKTSEETLRTVQVLERHAES